MNFGCLITNDEIRDGRIFELGYRGEHSSDRRRRGTGSGLYIAKQIMDAHGGNITVKSTPIKTANSLPLAKNEFVISFVIAP